MSKKPKRYLQFKASVKYNENDDEWCCSSSIPEITGDPCETIEDAIESYEILQRNYLLDNFAILPNYVKRTEYKINCRNASFLDTDDLTKLLVDLVDIRISLTYRLIEMRNRTLSEFEPTPVKSVFEEALPELQKLGEEPGITVSLKKAGETA